MADAVAGQAKTDLHTAFLDAAGRTGAATIPSGQLAGLTLVPGVYKAQTAALDLAAGQTLTLDAGGCGASGVWIFQAPSTVVANVLSRVVLLNGAKATNVFWEVGSSATIGTGVIFKGTIMAQSSITLNNAANLEGRALAQTAAVTLNTNTITVPAP